MKPMNDMNDDESAAGLRRRRLWDMRNREFPKVLLVFAVIATVFILILSAIFG